jgi:hypothetical protein
MTSTSDIMQLSRHIAEQRCLHDAEGVMNRDISSPKDPVIAYEGKYYQ